MPQELSGELLEYIAACCPLGPPVPFELLVDEHDNPIMTEGAEAILVHS